MITEDYVSFETAKLLKEKGFNEPCRGNYYWDFDDKDNSIVAFGEWTAQAYKNDFEDEVFICSAPTIQMAMKWLREVHKINIEVCLGFDADSELGYFYNPVISDLKNMALAIEAPEFDETEFTVYEEAAEAGIKYCLEKLI